MSKSRSLGAALAILLIALALALAIPLLNLPLTSEPALPLAPAPLDLTPYVHNPVLTPGAAGAWDAETVFSPHGIFQNGQYHLFYSGSASPTLQPTAIGYAVSADGLSFTKHPAPILQADGSGFDAVQVIDGVPLIVGDTWVLYYSAGPQPGPGPAIGRATAPAPTGPWTRRADPVLTSGRPGEWDAGFVVPYSIVATAQGYAMYYAGGGTWPSATSAIGLATSPDGITWTKYNNPATASAPFAASDPVLTVGAAQAWDASAVWGCAVRPIADGWEMFYTGSDSQQVRIGYATSADGMRWTKYASNPIMAPGADPVTQVGGLPILQAPTVVVHGSACIVYYDYGVGGAGIGAATGTMTRPPRK